MTFKSSHSNAQVNEEVVSRKTAIPPGNFVMLDANGNLVDSGVSSSTTGVILQTETVTYVNAMIAAASPLTSSEIIALDSFIIKMKAYGAWALIQDFFPIAVANNIAASYIGLKGGALTPSTGIVSGDFIPKFGYLITANSAAINKWLDTNIIPDNYTNSYDVSYGCVIPIPIPYQNITQYLLSLNPVSGTQNLYLSGSSIGDSRSLRMNIGQGSKVCTWSMVSNKLTNAFNNGVRGIDYSNAGTSPTISMSTSMTIFKGINNGTAVYSTGCISALFLGKGLTSSMNKKVNDAINELYQAWGILANNPLKIGGLGNSIIAGTGASTYTNSFIYLLSRNIGGRLVNNGLPTGICQNHTYNTQASTLQRYLDLYNEDINILLVCDGTNDMNLVDSASTAVSDPTKLAAFQAALTTILTNLLANTNAKILLATVPWCSVPSSTKNLDYVNASVAAAKAAGIKTIIDLYNIFLDTGSPATYFSDGTHPNDNGAKFINQHNVAAAQGRIYRDPTLAFGTIAAGATATATVTMYGALVGQSVSLGLPSGLDQRIKYSATVTSADTVTISAFNTDSINSVVVGNQVIRTTVFID